MAKVTFPQDWETATLGEVCKSITDGTHFTPRYTTEGVPFYSVENLTANDFINTKFISEADHLEMIKRCKPEKGDILMTRIGSIGDTKLIDWDVNASIYVSLALLKVNDVVDPTYLYSYSRSQQFVKEIESRSLLNAAPKKINMGEISSVVVHFPKDRNEQLAIAKALSGIEELIEKMKTELHKLKKVFSGVNDTLLNPINYQNTKFALAELCDIKTGSRNNQDKSESGQYKFFVRSDKIERIDSFSYESEAILIPGEGRIGEIFHYIDEPHEVHQRVYRISDPDSRVSMKYLYWYLRKHFGPHAMTNTVKATVDSLRLPTFLDFEVALPNLSEQKRVSTLLDEFETLIQLSETLLIKYECLKKGMAHDLLTGKVRLV
jgi:type I restriction enzyme S subunit